MFKELDADHCKGASPTHGILPLPSPPMVRAWTRPHGLVQPQKPLIQPKYNTVRGQGAKH